MRVMDWFKGLAGKIQNSGHVKHEELKSGGPVHALYQWHYSDGAIPSATHTHTATHFFPLAVNYSLYALKREMKLQCAVAMEHCYCIIIFFFFGFQFVRHAV